MMRPREREPTVFSINSHGSEPRHPSVPDAPSRGRSRLRGAAHLDRRLGPTARDLRDRLHRDGPRVRSLHHGQARRNEGDRLLRGLRSRPLVHHDRRNPLRRARDSGRRVREGAGHDLDRDDSRARGVPDLPLGVVPEEGPLRLGRVADARRHGLAPGLGGTHLRRTAVGQSRRGL